jgi:hypothetical protein
MRSLTSAVLPLLGPTVSLLIATVALLMALLVPAVALMASTVSLLMLMTTGTLFRSTVILLVPARVPVVPTGLVSSATLAVPVGGVTVVVGVTFVGGMTVAVLGRSVPITLAPPGPALVSTPAIVVEPLLVGLVSSSVFSMRICHGFPHRD